MLDQMDKLHVVRLKVTYSNLIIVKGFYNLVLDFEIF